VCLHGERDDVVPIGQSEVYVAAAQTAGDDALLVRVPGGHFEHLDPTSAAVDALRAALERL
jgi:dipeptidyl aminopeptidase/acylaminoacyl peptidase